MRVLMKIAIGACLVLLSAPMPLGAATTTAPDRYQIERVDFRNFTYAHPCVGEGPTDAQLQDGMSPDPIPTAPETPWVQLGGVGYGWLANETDDVAVVWLQCSTGGTGVFSQIDLFAMRSGKVAPIANLAGGDRADGGIAGVGVAWGRILVTRYAVDHPGYAVCCPTHLVTTVYHWTGSKLVEDSSASQKFGLP